MVDAAQSHADDEDDRQAEPFGEIGGVGVRSERDAETADALDQHAASRFAQGFESADDAVDVDDAVSLGGADMRRHGGLEQVGADERLRQASARRRKQRLDVFVLAFGVGSGGDRLHADGVKSGVAQGVEQRAADEGFADFGVGADDEPGRLVVGRFVVHWLV